MVQARVLPTAGTLLDAVGGGPSGSPSWEELDWDGNIVWQYTETRSNYHPHHDFEKIYNPKLGDSTFIYIANKDLTSAQCLAAGCDPAKIILALKWMPLLKLTGREQ